MLSIAASTSTEDVERDGPLAVVFLVDRALSGLSSGEVPMEEINLELNEAGW